MCPTNKHCIASGFPGCDQTTADLDFWICSSSPPFTWQSLAHVRRRSCGDTVQLHPFSDPSHHAPNHVLRDPRAPGRTMPADGTGDSARSHLCQPSPVIDGVLHPDGHRNGTNMITFADEVHYRQCPCLICKSILPRGNYTAIRNNRVSASARNQPCGKRGRRAFSRTKHEPPIHPQKILEDKCAFLSTINI